MSQGQEGWTQRVGVWSCLASGCLGERKGGWIPGACVPLLPDPVWHLGAEVMLLQLAPLPQVPAAHSVVQAPCPEPSAIIRNVDAAGPIRVALELPGERRAQVSTLEAVPL